MSQPDVGKTRSHGQRIVSVPSLQLRGQSKVEVIEEGGIQTSRSSVKEPPEDQGKADEAEWILQHHLRT